MSFVSEALGIAGLRTAGTTCPTTTTCRARFSFHWLTNAEKFLPEVIGFNLGYEQLPLHLLITAYELKELHIDPYYFTLHITVDNADSGHAKQAVDAVFSAMHD
jgi:hypothetical protein